MKRNDGNCDECKKRAKRKKKGKKFWKSLRKKAINALKILLKIFFPVLLFALQCQCYS